MAEIQRLRGLLEQAQPVAWMVYTLDGASVCVTDNPADFTPEHKALPLYTTPPPCPTCEALARTVMMDQTAHDTAPPQRKPWVGLTAQEAADCWSTSATKTWQTLEAKLKEKNI